MMLRCLLASVMIASISMNAMEDYPPSSSDEESEQSYESEQPCQKEFSKACDNKNLPLMRHILEKGYPVDKETALSYAIYHNDRLGTALLLQNLQKPINKQWEGAIGGFLHSFNIDSRDARRTATSALNIAEELILHGADPHIELFCGFSVDPMSALGKIKQFSGEGKNKFQKLRNEFFALKEKHDQEKTEQSAKELEDAAKRLVERRNTLVHYGKAIQLFSQPAAYFATEHFTLATSRAKRKPNVASMLTAREMGTARKKARGLVALARPETIQETIQSGDIKALQEFVAANPASVSRPYNLGVDHPLWCTVGCDNKEARKFLIQKGMDPKIIFVGILQHCSLNSDSFNISVLKEILEEYQVNPAQAPLPDFAKYQNWIEFVQRACWTNEEPKEEYDEKKRHAIALLQAAYERHRAS